MTKKEVANLLMVIAMTYPNSKIASSQENLVDEVNAWHIFLSDMDCNGVNLALKSFVKSHGSPFPPSVSELVEEYNKISEKVQTEELSEMQAWNLCYNAICESGGDDPIYAQRAFDKLPEIVQRTVGTPGNLHEMATDSRFNEAVERSNFLRNFERQRERMAEERRFIPEVRAMIEAGREERKSLVSKFDTPVGIATTAEPERETEETWDESAENHAKVREMIERMKHG